MLKQKHVAIVYIRRCNSVGVNRVRNKCMHNCMLETKIHVIGQLH